MIGSLAKELSAEIDPESLGDLGNPADLLSGLFSGGANGKLGNLVSTVVNKLDSKMKSGELNEQKLMGEAGNMMQKLNIFENHKELYN